MKKVSNLKVKNAIKKIGQITGQFKKMCDTLSKQIKILNEKVSNNLKEIEKIEDENTLIADEIQAAQNVKKAIEENFGLVEKKEEKDNK